MKKKLITLLMALLLLSCIPVRARAEAGIDMTRRGSITVTMHLGKEPVPGGTLTMYRVAEVREDDGNYSFGLTGDFASYPGSIADLNAPELAGSLAEYGKNFTGRTETVDKQGTVRFDDLEPGLYLFVQKTPAKGYSAVSPFLVSLPYRSGDTYVYDVDAGTKMELEKEPTPTQPPEEPGDKLPQTGQLWWPVPLLMMAGLTFLVVGFLRRKEGAEREK